MSTPAGILATKIVERLINENLISQQDGGKVVIKLAEGKLRAEDWRLPIELAAARAVSEEAIIQSALPAMESKP